MATTVNGNISWGIVPYDGSTSNLATMSYDYRNNFLKSANDPLRYQIQWFSTVGGTVTEGTEPNKLNWTGGSSLTNGAGDLVNVIFKVYTTTDNSTTYPTNWDLIGTIKKSRDIANKKYLTGGVPTGHRFTIDVSQLVADQLSYSLVPINKGTWQSYEWGGMNGGLTMQDNVIGGTTAAGSAISAYNVSPNGTFRKLRITTTYEVINGAGDLITPTETGSSDEISVINSVNQFGNDDVYYYLQFLHNAWASYSAQAKRFNTNCPNWYTDTSSNKVALNKKVRMDEQAEWLYWYVSDTFNGNNSTDYYNLVEIYGKTFTADGVLENTFVLADFTTALDLHNSTSFAHEQNRMLVQNVSPDFINNNAFVPQTSSQEGLPIPYTTSISPITASTHRYRLYFRGYYYQNETLNDGTAPCNCWVNIRHSAVNWYEIDREDENIPYGYVRFHWLNRMGGIDSYTAKIDVV